MNEFHLEPLLLTVSQTAERLNLSEKTVRRYISNGELPLVRIGSAIRVPEVALRKWIEDNTLYNDSRVELVPSNTGEHICNSISETASTTCPTSRHRDAKLDALLEPVTSR